MRYFALILLLAALGCGESFSASDPSPGTGQGGSGTGGSAAGGGGTGAGSVGGSGGEGHYVATCGAGSTELGISLWTRLEDVDSVTNPGIGSGDGAQVSEDVSFLEGTDGLGAHMAPDGRIRFAQQVDSQVNLDPRRGTIDFCYRTLGSSTNRAIFTVQTANNGLLELVTEDDQVLVHARITQQTLTYAAEAQALSEEWQRITLSWALDAGVEPLSVRLFVGGEEWDLHSADVVAGFALPPPSESQHFWLGSADAVEDRSPNAAFDEFHVYPEPITP